MKGVAHNLNNWEVGVSLASLMGLRFVLAGRRSWQTLRSSLFGLLQFVTVSAFESMTRSEFGTALIIFPDLVITGFLWLFAQPFFFKNGSLGITIQLQKMGLLVSIPTVG